MRPIDMRWLQAVGVVVAWLGIGDAPGVHAFFWIPIIVAAIASAYSAYSSYEANTQAADAAEDMARYNAELARNRAEQERLNQAARERDARREARMRLARIRGGYAKAGVLMEGTPFDFMLEQVGTDEYNIQQQARESQQRQQGLMQEGDAALFEGSILADRYDARAQSSAVGGTLGTLASIGEGASRIGARTSGHQIDSWADIGDDGIPGPYSLR